MFKKLRSIARYLYTYLKADTYIAVYPDIKASRTKVNLFEYHPQRFYNNLYNEQPYNLGDSLSFVVVDWMLRRAGKSIDSNKGHNKKKYVHLNSIGSNVFSSFQNAVIWGSGSGAKDELCNHKEIILNHSPFRKLDVRAVRGPLTRDLLIKYGHKCPEVYGDPAILMPLIYQPKLVDEKNDILVIPQFLYESDFRDKYQGYTILSMNTNDYKYVIDQIASAKLVITSSLHAIILAEAYGIPAVGFKSLPKDFKYRDYYASTGRPNVRLEENFESALSATPPPLPNLSALQKGIMEAFPYDLWI